MCLWSFDLVKSVRSEFNGGTLRTVCDSVASKFCYIYMHICVHICVSKFARYWIPTTNFWTLRTFCGICVRVAVRCSVLQCGAAWCRVLRQVVCCSVQQSVALFSGCHSVLCYNVLQCVAVCCSVLQCVAV